MNEIELAPDERQKILENIVSLKTIFIPSTRNISVDLKHKNLRRASTLIV